MESFLDQTPVEFREQNGIAALAGDLNGLMGLTHLID
jgi:hypothetical protein